MSVMRGCDVVGCQNKHNAKGYCCTHYRRFREYGDPLLYKPKNACSVGGCRRPYECSGFCALHYKRVKAHGDVDTNLSHGARNPKEIIILGEIALVPLTKGLFATIDVEDIPKVGGQNWHCSAGYAVNAEKVRMHVLISGIEGIDHINRLRSDNRKSNLRVATRHQQAANSSLKSSNSSGYKGVSYDKTNDRWRAALTCQGEAIWLGRHNTKEAAARAYNEGAILYFGEFAVLNDIKEV